MTEIASDAAWRAWRDDLADASLIHADAAACSARSRTVTLAVREHLDREAREGAYVAEENAAAKLEFAERRLATLSGADGGRVIWAPNASQAFRWVILSLSLPQKARVGTVPSEYPANQATLDEVARRGYELVTLPTDKAGHIDVDSFQRIVPSLSCVAFPHIPSHRGIVQPAREVSDLCRDAGAIVVIDAAQSLGQIDLAGITGAAVVGTSRKWLQGPRGVGFVVLPRELRDRVPFDQPSALRVDDGDSPIAEKVGLAAALGRWPDLTQRSVHDRIASLTQGFRGRILERTRWRSVEPSDEATGTTTLAHPQHDPAFAWKELLLKGILTSIVPLERSKELAEPLLRVSLHAFIEEEEVDAIVDALPA